MKILAFVLFVAFILVFIVIKIKATNRPNNSDEVWPFYAKKPLTQPEQVLYFRLKDSLPDQMILAQVQLSRFLGVKKGSNFHSWNNRINRMSVDFLICGKDSSIIAAVELDDKSHERQDRIKADNKKDKALLSANVRTVRWNVKELPDMAAIRAAILIAGSLSPTTISNTVIAPVTK